MKNKAFTLVELLIVILIIVILVGLLLVGLQKVRLIKDNIKCQVNLKTFTTSLNLYQTDYKTYPYDFRITTDSPQMAARLDVWLNPYWDISGHPDFVEFTLPWSCYGDYGEGYKIRSWSYEFVNGLSTWTESYWAPIIRQAETYNPNMALVKDNGGCHKGKPNWGLIDTSVRYFP